MEYDRDIESGLVAIQSQFRITLYPDTDENDNTLFYFEFALKDNLPMGTSYNLGPTYMKVEIFYPNQSDLGLSIYEGQGSLIPAGTQDGFLRNNWSLNPIVTPETQDLDTLQFKIQGRIYLNNNTFYVINNLMTLQNPQVLIDTFFNPTT